MSFGFISFKRERFEVMHRDLVRSLHEPSPRFFRVSSAEGFQLRPRIGVDHNGAVEV